MGAGTDFDHFDQGSLPSPWTAVTSGEGVVSMADSCIKLSFTAGATNDGSAVVMPFDRTKGNYQRYAVCYSSTITAPVFRPSLRLITNVGTPANDTRPNINAKTILWMYQNDVAGVRAGQAEYFDTGGTAQSWVDSSKSWSTGAQNSTPTITNPDYHVVGFDWDEVNSRFRMFWLHAATGTSFLADSGYKLMMLTDWVGFASAQQTTGGNKWVVVGFLENTLASFGATEGLNIEWYVQEYGDTLSDFWGNQKLATGGTYQIKHWQYPTGSLGYVWLPETRTGIAIAKGAPAWKSNQCQFGSCMKVGSTYWMAFSGNSGGRNSLGVASSSTAQDASWTEYASNPVIAPSVGTDLDNIGQNCLFEDHTDTSARRYKWLVTALSSIDSKFRVYLYYASAVTGPYTLDGLVLDYNASDGNTGVQLYSNPVLYNGTWYLYYVGTDNANQWKNYVATASTMAAGAFTKDRSFDLLANGIEMTVTSASSTSHTVTVNSTTGLVKDALVLYDNDSTNTTWAIGKVRKVIDATNFELYGLLPGLTSSGAFRTVDKGKKCINFIEKVGSEWRFWGTAFGVFYLHATYNANYEGSATWTNSALTGSAHTIDWKRTPNLLLARDDASGTSENVRGVLQPYYTPLSLVADNGAFTMTGKSVTLTKTTVANPGSSKRSARRRRAVAALAAMGWMR